MLSNVISLWEREPYIHDFHWKYIPSPEVEQHREFYIKNIAPHSKEGGVMTDINYKRWLENEGKVSKKERCFDKDIAQPYLKTRIIKYNKKESIVNTG